MKLQVKQEFSKKIISVPPRRYAESEHKVIEELTKEEFLAGKIERGHSAFNSHVVLTPKPPPERDRKCIAPLQVNNS